MENKPASVKQKDSGDTSEFLTTKELADKLKISVQAVIKWTGEHRLPVVKLGKLNRYSSAEIRKRLSSGNLLTKGN